MNDYFFNKSSLIIIKNFVKGLALSLPLLFEGIAKQFMYLILIVFICKGLYDLYKEHTIEVPLLILLSVPLSGAFTGLCVGVILIALYYNLVLELSSLLLHLILANLIVLAGGIYLANRFDVYKN